MPHALLREGGFADGFRTPVALVFVALHGIMMPGYATDSVCHKRKGFTTNT